MGCGKKMAGVAMAAVLACGMASTAYAGQWRSDSIGWWYDNGNGTYPTNCWQWIDGNGDGVAESYFFTPYGYCMVSTYTPDGYQVDASGAWNVNGVVQTKTMGTSAAAGQTTGTANQRQTKVTGVFIDENTERDQWWALNGNKVQNDSRIRGNSAERSENMLRYYPDCPGEEYTTITIEGNKWEEYNDTGYKGSDVDSGTITWSGDGTGTMKGEYGKDTIIIINNDIIEINGSRYRRGSNFR